MLQSFRRYVIFTWVYLLILVIGFTIVYKFETNGIQSLIADNVDLQNKISNLESRIHYLEADPVDR